MAPFHHMVGRNGINHLFTAIAPKGHGGNRNFSSCEETKPPRQLDLGAG